jgi:pentafunctional AROM polypeptide
MSSSTPSRTTVFPNTPKAYDLVVGHNILQTVPDEVKRLCSKKDGTLGKIVIVTDVLLHKLWGSKLVQAFKKKLGITPPTYVVEVGEASKSRSSKAAIEAWMFQHQCYRDACVVALGGGVVGDLAGFVAATYMRGISVVQVPTSILAMVDSSIGGKTAIDVPYGKNLVGAFHHPKVVIADLKVLDTLPPRQVSNGLAEAIKHAIIRDSKLFEMFETNVDAILAKDPSLLQHIIFESMKIKGAVVTRDEREGGLRAILNIGHTIGHGIEAIMQPTLLHGECVSIGLVKGAEVSRALGLCSSATVGRIVRCLKSYKLPTEMPDVNKYPSCNAKEVIHRMIYDKKNTKGTIKCVLSDKIGSIAMVSGGGFAHIIDPSLLLRILSPGVLVNVDRNIMPSPIKCSSNFSVPGSKSLSNRLLLLAGLSSPNVPCRLRGLLQSDDTDVMMSALESLGLATFEWDNEDLIVSGTGGHFYTSNKNASLNGCHELYMGNAGTATRFIQSVMTLSGRKGTKQNPSGNGVKITGSNRALARPQGPLVEALRAHGCSINYCKKEGHLPIICRESENGLPGGIFTIEGKVSSQFVSSILISAPYANQPMSIVLAEKGRPTSSTYIDMTVSCMKLFGIDVEKVITEEGNVQFNVPNGTYAWCGGKDSICRVECDASSATYPLAFAAVTASEVTVHGVGSSSLQGDAGFAHLLGKMGCEVSMTEVTTTIKGPPLYASGDVGINAVSNIHV